MAICPGKSLGLFALLLGASLAAFAQEGPKDRILQAVESSPYAVIRGSANPRARAEFDAGRVDGNMKIKGVSIVFAQSPGQQAALRKLLLDQQDRLSPKYHQWLTPEQYGERFGMSQSDLAKVSSWLQSQGLQIDGVSRNRTRISLSGKAGQIEAAFRTQLHHYLINGEVHFANATELSSPSAFAGIVLAVNNLSDFRPKPRSSGPASSRWPQLSPHYTYGISGNHYIAPADFATIYDVNPLYSATPPIDGTGQTIAIMGQTAIYTTDIDVFRAAAGLPARTSANFVQTQVPNSGNPAIISDALTEADLDLEWAEAVAPNANIVYVFVGNAANFSAFNALEYAVDNNVAQVISITYGVCEANLDSAVGITALALQAVAQQANAQGQTIVAASGDVGAADCDAALDFPATQGLAVDVPASIPEVTGVGGTELLMDPSSTTTTTYWNATNTASGGSAISYIPEEAWNDSQANSQLAATGGGASTVFAKPVWQVGLNVPSDGQRDVPDIALAASPDHDPYLICSDQISNGSCVNGFVGNSGLVLHTGGTSLGAPAFAGIVALINQKTQSSQGNVNPTLYSLAGTNPTAFHDITTGTNQVPCAAGSPGCSGTGGFIGFFAGPGYDQATGLGSIDANVLVNAWPMDYSLSVSPTAINIASPGSQGTAAITLSPVASFTGTVTLSCTPQSGVAGLTCQVSPTTVTSANPTATLTVLTVGGGGSASVAKPGIHRMGWIVGSGATLFAGIFLVQIPVFRRRRIRLPAFLLLALLAGGIGCGGGGSSSSTTNPSPTPAGIYTIKVTGTSGSISFSTTVMAGVQ